MSSTLEKWQQFTRELLAAEAAEQKKLETDLSTTNPAMTDVIAATLLGAGVTFGTTIEEAIQTLVDADSRNSYVSFSRANLDELWNHYTSELREKAYIYFDCLPVGEKEKYIPVITFQTLFTNHAWLKYVHQHTDRKYATLRRIAYGLKGMKASSTGGTKGKRKSGASVDSRLALGPARWRITSSRYWPTSSALPSSTRSGWNCSR
jgi:hypothetical protein